MVVGGQVCNGVGCGCERDLSFGQVQAVTERKEKFPGVISAQRVCVCVCVCVCQGMCVCG